MLHPTYVAALRLLRELAQALVLDYALTQRTDWPVLTRALACACMTLSPVPVEAILSEASAVSAGRTVPLIIRQLLSY